MARDGADLGEALDGLRATYARVLGGEPDFRAVRALCVAWSEETLGYLHQLSCENPLTGLASLAHLRARLSEVYRAAEQGGKSTNTSHALVVVDLPLLARAAVWRDPFGERCGWSAAGRDARALVFPGEETIGQVSRAGWSSIASAAICSPDVSGCCVPSSRTWPREPARARVWIEGLPPSDDGAGFLLDEIARG